MPSRPRAALKVSLRRGLCLALAAAFVAVASIAGCVSIDERQRAWIFRPSKDTWGGARRWADGLDNVWIEFEARDTNARVRLHGLWLPQQRADAPVLLYLHGARWNVVSSAGRLRRMHQLGFSVLGIDYRGFGQSTDALPSEASAYEDARAAWRWLASRYPQSERYVFGHSLGGAIAVHLASEAGDAAGLIVEGAFTSIPDVFSRFRWGWLPVAPLITQRFDAASRMPQVRAPVLVVHGAEDRLIPPDLGRSLFERARAPKRFVLVEGGSHHDTNAIGHAEYRRALNELFGMPL